MILVTGFEPFGGQPINSSWEIVSRLPDEIRGVRILKLKVPVVYYRSVQTVAKVIEIYPEITDVILVGESGGRSRIAIEMIGVNFDDASTPDNAGVIRVGEKIDPEGPDAYFATLPVLDLVKHMLTDQQIPVILSWSAGQFVCNHLMYGVSRVLKETNRDIRTGFVHVPYSLSQAANEGVPGLPLNTMQKSLQMIVEYIIDLEK